MTGTPYIRFFGDDWLSGTQSLTLEERGVLITLVALTATAGEAPAYDVERLARRLGCTRAKTIKLMNALCETGKITIEDGRIIEVRGERMGPYGTEQKVYHATAKGLARADVLREMKR
jgi:hypothetical protein